MLISHYFEFEEAVTGGIRESVDNQRKMLDERGIEYVTEPRLDADVFHCNLMGPRASYYAKRAQKKGVPVVINTHVTAEDFGDSFRLTNVLAKPLRPYLERVYSLGDQLICPSEYNQEVIDGYTDVSTRVISNGVDAEKLAGFEELREEYLDRLDLTPPVVFMVGHVIKRKGLETFVETARKMPELDFVWFGPIDRKLKGRETKRLIDTAPENCQFPGYVEDIRGAYAAGDIFFFPTHEENEGIALLEAMIAGKPPVVRDIDTFEWLDDEHNCLKATDGFTTALDRVQDQSLRERLGENAAKAGEQFRLENIASAYESLYEEVTA
jgi:1,2-diacylglycerol-3-alpha-glucose alpha-1,2-glucosyltransferase